MLITMLRIGRDVDVSFSNRATCNFHSKCFICYLPMLF